MKPTIYDKTDIYESKIKPKLEEIKKICNEEQIPFFSSCCVKNTETQTEYQSELISPLVAQVHIVDDKMADFVNVVNGFETIPKRDLLEVNFSD